MLAGLEYTFAYFESRTCCFLKSCKRTWSPAFGLPRGAFRVSAHPAAVPLCPWALASSPHGVRRE